MSKLVGGRPSMPPGYERVQTGTRTEYVGPRRYKQPGETIDEQEYARRLSELGQAPARRSAPSQWAGSSPSRPSGESYMLPAFMGGSPASRRIDPRKQFESSWRRREVPTWEIRPIATAALGPPPGVPAPAVASSAPPPGGPQPASPGEPITPAKSVMPTKRITPAPVVLDSVTKRNGARPLGKGRTSKFFIKTGAGLMADDDEKKKLTLGA